MPSLLLINPWKSTSNWIRYFQLPPISLFQVAASVPEHWDITLWDENVQGVYRGGFEADLVGLTAMTAQADRAYELADAARSEGRAAVLGGIHPSSLPDEAAAHADTVVVGEAEPVLHELLSDFERHALKPLYRSGEFPPLDRVPPPRTDLEPRLRYLTRNLPQTARGCPWDCDFCSVVPVFGRRFRHRPLRDVLVQIEALPGRFVLFLDDNINANPAYCAELLAGMASMGRRWVGQASLSIAKHRGLLELAQKSGCMGLLVGLETIGAGRVDTFRKLGAAGPPEEAVRRIQDHGIALEGSFIFGLDGDTPEVFERTVAWAEEVHLCTGTFQLLTPYPGTRLHERLSAEGRILTRDWDRYTQDQVVIRPAGMSPERLWEGFVWARKTFYRTGSIARRVWYQTAHRPRHFAYNILRRGSNASLRGRGPLGSPTATTGGTVRQPRGASYAEEQSAPAQGQD